MGWSSKSDLQVKKDSVAEEKGIQAKWIVTHVQGASNAQRKPGARARSQLDTPLVLEVFFCFSDFCFRDSMEWDYGFKSPFVFSLPCSNRFGQIYVDRMMFYVWDTCHIICMIHGLSIPLSHPINLLVAFQGWKRTFIIQGQGTFSGLSGTSNRMLMDFFTLSRGSGGFNPRVDSLSIEVII